MPAVRVSGPCVGGRVPVNYAQQSLGDPSGPDGTERHT